MVDEEIFVDKLQYINQYTDDLRQMRGQSRDQYLTDMIRQRAVERTLMNLIQACIDLAQHIRATEDLAESETAKQEIQALGEAGVITSETQVKMEEAVGFRNILAHRYGDVDQEVVFDVLQDDLQWFERFQQELAQWFQQQHST
ncbi:type VII toxin-antitoxin system HepT family RNase toxin [Haladaptatus sp. DFWS20]|uniref:type VII toxin-antitoxin system HepT family RNase toxin n=1 Tax=Haladaptatus sp. DFWS20 TaxID=3403467 RepID=UPI003EBC9A16